MCALLQVSSGQKRLSSAEKQAILSQRLQLASLNRGLCLFDDQSKGKGVFTLISFNRDDYVTQYEGELITAKEGRAREKRYSHSGKGCFLFFTDCGKCIDATSPTRAYGRWINHTRSVDRNLIAQKVVTNDDRCRIFFCARRRIEAREELLYDYGDRASRAAFLTYNDPPGFVTHGKLHTRQLVATKTSSTHLSVQGAPVIPSRESARAISGGGQNVVPSHASASHFSASVEHIVATSGEVINIYFNRACVLY